MKVVCIGGGPGAAYLSILLRRQVPGCDVSIYERNARGETDGWGIIYPDDLLAKLQAADPHSAQQIRNASARWEGQVLSRDGRKTSHPGGRGYGLERRRLLEILSDRATELGVQLHHRTDIQDIARFADADIIVASDGAGSALRRADGGVFRPRIAVGRNKYIWLGVGQLFKSFTFAFVTLPAGQLWFHAYAYGNGSTCIVECAPETWAELGFDRMTADESAAALSRIFARELDGHKLLAKGSGWQSFRTIRNRRWVSGRTVLLGDAAHTAHFAIGSGTKLALEDAIALAAALQRTPDVASALRAYERDRRGAVAKAQSHATSSALWFETMSRFGGMARLTDEEFFTLLLERRSRLQVVLPPRLFLLIAQASHRSSSIARLRRNVGSWYDLVKGSRL